MTAFRRTFTQDPGLATLLEIESVNIIDLPPVGPPLGAGTGAVLLVAEFESGPMNTPTANSSSSAIDTVFGGFGFPTPALSVDGPVAQQSGGNEPWNGNGYIWLQNKTFSNPLVICRVDNSAGAVVFSRLACLLGAVGPYAAANGDAATWELDGGPTATATIVGNKANILATGAIYPVAGLAGQDLILPYDGNDPIQVIFTVTDVTLADVITRINNRAGEVIAFDNGGQLDLRSIREGTAAYMAVTGGTARATLGLPTAPTQDVWTTTAVVDVAGNYQLRVNRFVNGVSTDFDTAVVVGPAGSLPLLRDALQAAVDAVAVPGVANAVGGANDFTSTADNNVIITVSILQEPNPGDLTVVNTAPGVVTEDYGDGNVGDVNNFSALEAATFIDAVATISSEIESGGFLRVCNTSTPATGTIKGDSGALLTILGFDTTTVANAAAGSNVTIPAGTRVQDSTATATVWVTLENIATGTVGGPFTALVRPFTDTDTAVASGVGNVTTLISELPDGFSVTNTAGISRLTAPQLDNAYITALNATLADDNPNTEVNFIGAARTSPTIRSQLRANVLEATANGRPARKAITRARLGVSVAQAVSDVTSVRAERLQFTFPGVQTRIARIADVGTAGGIGFTATGVIDVGADSFLLGARSILLPEDNAGQDLADTNVGPLNFLALETTYDSTSPGGTTLVRADYDTFKAAGITAPRLDRTVGAFYQSDVTAVDPSARPTQADANRRAFADFINDTLQDIGVKYAKKTIKPPMERAILSSVNGFLELLLSPDQPDASRLQAYSVERQPTVQGLLQFTVLVRMYDVAKSIVFRTTIGPTVEPTGFTVEQLA